MTRPWRPEPATVTLIVAVWATFTAFSFLVAGEKIWTRPGFSVLATFDVPARVWAILFVVNAIFLLSNLTFSASPLRATTALATAGLWFFIGATNIVSLAHIGLLGAFGPWCIFCAFLSLQTVSQWAYYE